MMRCSCCSGLTRRQAIGGAAAFVAACGFRTTALNAAPAPSLDLWLSQHPNVADARVAELGGPGKVRALYQDGVREHERGSIAVDAS